MVLVMIWVQLYLYLDFHLLFQDKTKRTQEGNLLMWIAIVLIILRVIVMIMAMMWMAIVMMMVVVVVMMMRMMQLLGNEG